MEVLKTVGTLWDISTSASILKDILGLKPICIQFSFNGFNMTSQIPRKLVLRVAITYLSRSNLGRNQGGQLSSDDERRHDDVYG